MSEKIEQFLIQNQPVTPCLVMDMALVAQNYQCLASLLPDAKIYYAMKANPATAILRQLSSLGAYFDVASLNEIKIALSEGISPLQLCYGNTIKKTQDILAAYELGVRFFMIDSERELDKLNYVAPHANVFYRIETTCQHARWPLASKFGCSLDEAKRLIKKTKQTNLTPYGISFHVGSQQLEPLDWKQPIADASSLYQYCLKEQITLRALNIGGGFPAQYKESILELEVYTQSIDRLLTRYFPNNRPEIILEPGRYLVGSAGVLLTEVVLIKDRYHGTTRSRWVYLDAGKYNGLSEAGDNLILYSICSYKQGPESPVILAGPTCDSHDILYHTTKYMLPDNLQVGDLLRIYATGAYTFSCSSIGFNGFEPLTVHCI